MKKQRDEITTNYIYFNRVAILLAIYVFLFPIITKIVKIFYSDFGKCVYKELTGNPCPLCGGTRYIEGLGQVFNNPSYLLHPFGVMIIVAALEIISRILIVIKIDKIKNKKRIMIIDAIWHSCILIAFFAYEIIFMLK